MKRLTVLILALFLAGCAWGQIASTNIAEVFLQLGFDPSASSCATLVHISDIHISLADYAITSIPITTNLDPRLVTMANDIRPRPDAIIVSGDLGMMGGISPGFPAYWPWATQEVTVAKQELTKLTNCGAMYVVPGNHDSMYGREDGYLFTNAFVGFSRYTNFTLAGLPIFVLDSQNGGWIDAEQRAWLAGWRSRLDRTKPILVMSHIPMLSVAQGTIGRELGKDALWFVDKWQAPVWFGVGHNHCRSLDVYNYGSTCITQYMTPSVNRHISTSPWPWNGLTAGFAVWCITNGSVRAIISGVLTNSTYYVFDPDSHHPTPCRPYENLTNVLFHVEEGHFNRSNYAATAYAQSGMKDVGYYWLFPQQYICRLPVERYPNATRAFLLCGSTNDLRFYFGSDTIVWNEAPCEFFLDSVASVVIPDPLRSGPLWFRATMEVNSIGGFGLGTTNPISEFAAWAGTMVGDSDLTPESRLSWGGWSWQSFLFGVDSDRADGLKELNGLPWLGGWPSRKDGTLRFPARASLSYRVEQSASVTGPWSPAVVTWGSVTNGWREGIITNTGSLVFRITAR